MSPHLKYAGKPQGQSNFPETNPDLAQLFPLRCVEEAWPGLLG